MAERLFLRLCLLVVASLLGSPLAFAQAVIVERDTPLLPEPRQDAAPVTTLKQGAQAEALTTKGPWLHLRAGPTTGWTYSFNVRFVSSASGSARGGAGAALSRLTSRQPTVTPTIGVRGLDPDTLRKAPFNESQLAQLERYTSTNPQARAGASASGLKASRIEYLDAK